MLKISYGASEVFLRSPEFGDRRTLDTNMVIAQTMNGTTKTYKGSRPSYVQQNVSSIVNSESDMEDFVAFFTDYAGLEMTFEYYYNDSDLSPAMSIDGFIITQGLEIVTERDDCSFSVEFDFEYTTYSTDYLMPDVTCP